MTLQGISVHFIRTASAN